MLFLPCRKVWTLTCYYWTPSSIDAWQGAFISMDPESFKNPWGSTRTSSVKNWTTTEKLPVVAASSTISVLFSKFGYGDPSFAQEIERLSCGNEAPSPASRLLNCPIPTGSRLIVRTWLQSVAMLSMRFTRSRRTCHKPSTQTLQKSGDVTTRIRQPSFVGRYVVSFLSEKLRLKSC